MFGAKRGSDVTSPRRGGLFSPKKELEAEGHGGGVQSPPKIAKSSSFIKVKPKFVRHPITKTKEEWKKELTALEYTVLRTKGMEQTFSGKYRRKPATEGVYLCRGCDNPVLSSWDQLDAADTNMPWAIFTNILPGGVNLRQVQRGADFTEEVTCVCCDGFIGLRPSGGNIDVNSAAIKFRFVTKDQHKALMKEEDPGLI
mmetsp:Transcript_21932/g.37842  ORF Transcript_21932/g.37842 Transcript_21932/m.37842 type:complete len:199 (+) Transcript_21932:361-957(+)|eukprot:CAMPEP_0184706996 /NCGR_PEP_ID=MMETSP0313-20130426/37044_1 /TAXON_ID=2792 /ORGANISM="Porphyridium aerugineum, Strain SAG 1380-2" /LENGTH=198 /DNA_ID=CAMNT_0027168567 /DNA_START=655 /DNA_END=1251 /DNA_ORIENTATION=+